MLRRIAPLVRFGSPLLVALALAACASDPMRAARLAFNRGDYETALGELRALQRDDSSNSHLFGLELGVVLQALGDPKAGIAELREARDKMNELAAGNYTDWVASVFLDDRSRTWPGADYEHVMVRAVLALQDLVSGGHDAYAYAFQVLEQQEEIIRTFDPKERPSPKQAYKLVAFGNYLRAIINEQDPRGRSEAQREFAKVLELAPYFHYAKQDLQRATTGLFAAPGHGVVQILAMVGQAPHRVELKERATRDALMIAQLIWSYNRKRPFVPNIVPLPIPGLAFRDDNPDAVRVYADGVEVGTTATVTDVEATAKAEFDAMRPWALARAVIRRLLKTAVVEVGKEVVEHNEGRHRNRSDAIAIGLDILGNLWAASEGADLRCWNLLPATFQVLRVELPEGEHDITLRGMRDGHVVGEEQTVRVRVIAGYNTYVSGLVPTLRGGPAPLTSR